MQIVEGSKPGTGARCLGRRFFRFDILRAKLGLCSSRGTHTIVFLSGFQLKPSHKGYPLQKDTPTCSIRPFRVLQEEEDEREEPSLEQEMADQVAGARILGRSY